MDLEHGDNTAKNDGVENDLSNDRLVHLSADQEESVKASLVSTSSVASNDAGSLPSSTSNVGANTDAFLRGSQREKGAASREVDSDANLPEQTNPLKKVIRKCLSFSLF